MERDVRRASNQWRGCYAFEDITCDGEGTTPKRSGGLKMGQTYYYYYELDDGTEVHDPSLPSTTTCPYLPGQPVNLLWVPVEVRPPRDRSASMSSVTNADVKTMVPADKFLAPRPAPPIPTVLSRAKTSPLPIPRKRNARSISPRPERSQWSPRTLFGLRSHASQSQGKSGGRSQRGKLVGDGKGNPPSPTRYVHDRNASGPTSHNASPRSFGRPPLSPVLPLAPLRPAAKSSAYASTTLFTADNVEEDDDDDNFASQLSQMSMFDQSILTPLSPPFLGASPSSINTSKPLPQLPDRPPVRTPLPRNAVSAHPAKSQFSTAVTSPTGSYFDFSDDEDNEDDDAGADFESSDGYTDSPAVEPSGPGFPGYRLPDVDEAPGQAAGKPRRVSPEASRRTFGGPVAPLDPSVATTLDELRSELGYLGGIIVRK